MGKLLLVFIFLLLDPKIILAEVVRLKSGITKEGKVIEKSDDYIRIDLEDGILQIPFKMMEETSASQLRGLENFSPEKRPTVATHNESQDMGDEPAVDAIKPVKDVIKEEIPDEFVQALNDEIEATKGMENLGWRNNPDVTQKLKALSTFYKGNPESRFADDAYFVSLLLGFNHSARYPHVQQSLKDYIGATEVFVELHSSKKIEDETLKFLGTKFPELLKINVNPTAVFIPYNQILSYMRGYLDFYEKNFVGSIEEFTALKENVDLSWDKQGILGEVIYGQLIASNMSLGNIKQAQDLAQEAIARFPGVGWPQGYLELINKKQKEWDR